MGACREDTGQDPAGFVENSMCVISVLLSQTDAKTMYTILRQEKT